MFHVVVPILLRAARRIAKKEPVQVSVAVSVPKKKTVRKKAKAAAASK
jgi:hypothetical protein